MLVVFSVPHFAFAAQTYGSGVYGAGLYGQGDITPPVVSLIAPLNGATVSGTSVLFTASSSDDTGIFGVQFTVDGSSVGTSGTSSPYSYSWNSTSVADGSHTVGVVASDAAGNTATSSVTVTVSNTGPTFSGIASSTSATGATINWTTNKSATTLLNYGTTISYGLASSTAGTSTAHMIVLSGLSPSTLYHFQLSGTDAQTNVGTSSDFTFTTAALPITAPTVTIQSASSIGTSTATLNGTLVNNNNATSTIEGFNYGTTLAYGATASSTGAFTPSTFAQLVTSLTPNTLYHVQAFAVNSAGTGTSSDLTFTTAALPVTVPTVTIQAATGVATSSATLNGTLVNNNNATSTIQGFNYGTTLAYGSTASTTGSFSPGAFSQLIASLTPGALYHVQAFAVNSAGTGTSSDLTFTAAALPVSAPTVTVQSVSGISTSSATLNGTLVNNNNATSTIEGFNYGTTVSYGATASSTGAFTPSTFAQLATSLTPNTLYHVQAFASNSAGTGTSSDLTFTTASLPVTVPTITIQSTSGISTSTATLNGTLINNNNATSTIEGFNYGTTLAYGSTASTTGSFSPGTFSQLITSLSPSTTYHVQAFAVNSASTGTSSDLTFTTTTLPVSPPTVTIQTASGIATSSATLNGTLINNNNATSTIEGFNYGLTTAYGSTASSTGLFSAGTFLQSLTGLTPNTLYHYQTYATNSAGTGTSSDQTFTTASLPVTPPTLTIQATSGISTSSATLNGTLVNNNNATSTIQGFNYGVTTAYGATASTTGSFTPGTFSQLISSLTPNTLYHVQAFATNSAGTGTSSDITFTTTALSITVPTVTVQATSGISTSSASLNGTLVNNNNATSTIEGFNYGTSLSYGATASSTGSFSTGAFNQLVSSLTPGTLYHIQAFAINSAGTGTSTDQTFTTAALPITAPTVSIQAASGISTSSATLNGTLVNNNNATSTIEGFNYGLTTAYGSTASSTGLFSPGTFLQSISALAPNTLYHVQAFATNSAGTGTSSDLTFTTAALPVSAPTVSIQAATSVATSSATLNGTLVNNNNATSTIEGFNYGTTLAYGSTASTTGSFSPSTFSQSLVGLVPNTLYHYQTYAINSAGTGTSSDQTFTTSALPASAPSVTIQTTLGISTSSATFNGTLVNNNNATSTVTGFNYGTTLAYGQSASSTGIFTPSTFAQLVTSLIPNTLYHVQAFATNSAGTGTSTDLTFTTTALPVSPPTVTIQSASGISTSSATLNGTLANNNNATSTIEGFNYGTTLAYGSTASTTGSFSPGTFIQLIASLSPSTIYHVQAFAVNSAGTGTSSDITFTTTALPVTAPTVSIQTASGVATSSATLNGTLVNNSNATSTIEGFNYGLTSAYGSNASSTGLFSAGTFNQFVSSLTPGTLYHVQAFAINSAGIGTSSDLTFTTTALPVSAPTVTIQAASSISTSTAMLNGTLVNNNNATSTIEGFNYGTTLAYGSTASTTGSFSPSTFLQSITTLAPNTLYHVQAFATNSAGTGTSTDLTFTTAALPVIAPTVTTSVATTVTDTTAILNGAITADGNASSTLQGFNIGTTIAYGLATTTAVGTFGASSFSTTTTALTPVTLYHYRAYATNTAGTGYGADQTFTTTAAPDVTPPIISAVASSPADKSVSISWTTNEPATSIVNLGTTASYGTASSSVLLTTSHTIMFAGLTPLTIYHYQIQTADASNNISTSSDRTFTTNADVTPPVISSISATPTTSGVTITWTTDEPSTAQAVYGVTSSYTASTTLDSTLATTHTVAITGLAASSVYHFEIISVDPYGNTATSTDQVFSTNSIPTSGGGGGGGGGSSGGSGGGSSTPPPSSLPITPITPSIFTTNPVTTTVNTNTIGIVPTIGGFSGGVPFTLNLSARSHNEEVTRLQQVLVFKGLLDAQYVTGFLGTLTKRALITYQIQNGIPPLGKVGPLTRVVLNQDYAQASSLTFSAVGNPLQEVSTAPITDNTTGSGAGTNGTGIIIRNNVKIGSVGNDVRALQQFLSNYPAFYPSSTVNGIYGPLTRAAVEAFQLNFNLVISPSSAGYGKVGPVTRQKINELLH